MYKKIINNYDGLCVKVRIPDILIEFKKENQSFFRIIEVKNSSDEEYFEKVFINQWEYYQD